MAFFLAFYLIYDRSPKILAVLSPSRKILGISYAAMFVPKDATL